MQSIDGLTSKLLLRLHDGQEIEAVEMNTALEGGRKTICVSTQAGCAMGCVFCVTGQFGFARNLEAGEIVEQVLRFNQPDAPVTNVVFMGMGEPLANYAETLRAIRLLHAPGRAASRARGASRCRRRAWCQRCVASPTKACRSAWPSRSTRQRRSCARR